MNTDTLQPGRELDAIMAEKVMGWTDLAMCFVEVGNETYRKYSGHRPGDGMGWNAEVPHYSTDPAAMMKVLDKMWESFSVLLSRLRDDGPEWRCEFVHHGVDTHVASIGDTLPLAVARAALKAVERGRGKP